MAKAEVFHVVNNVHLDFESEGLKYDLRLLIEDGLIILKGSNGKERILFLGEREAYTGEPVKEPIAELPKPKKRSKGKK